MKNNMRIIIAMLSVIVLWISMTPVIGAASEPKGNTNLPNAIALTIGESEEVAVSRGVTHYYTFTVPEDGYISLTLVRNNLNCGPVVQISNSTAAQRIGGMHAFHTRYGTQDLLSFTSTPIGLSSGTYVATVFDGPANMIFNGENPEKNYDMSLEINFYPEDGWEQEPNDYLGQVNELVLNRSVKGSLYAAPPVNGVATDADYYRFTLETNGSIQLLLTQVDIINPFLIKLYNKDAQEIATAMFRENKSRQESQWISLEAGTYTVLLTKPDSLSFDHSTQKPYMFQVNYSEKDGVVSGGDITINNNPDKEVEPNDDTTLANSLTIGSPLSAKGEAPFFKDYFQVTVTQDGFLSFTLAKPAAKDLPLEDLEYYMMLRVFDSDSQEQGRYILTWADAAVQTVPIPAKAGMYSVLFESGEWNPQGEFDYALTARLYDTYEIPKFSEDETMVTYGFANPLLRGDLDGNGLVDSTDARITLQSEAGLAKLKAAELLVGDVDGNDVVDSTDARMILQCTVGLIGDFAW